MLPSRIALSKLLGTLYAAAGVAASWPVFLAELTRATGSNQAAILLHDMDHGDHSVSVSFGMDAAGIRAYADYYGARDIWMRKAAPLVYAGWLATSEQLCRFQELEGSEFYNDYLVPNNMAHAMWGVLEKTPTRIINIGLYRDLRQQPYEPEDLTLLRLLAPHLDRAFRLHVQVSELKSQTASLQSALDLLANGVIFVATNGRVAHANRIASALLAENNGLRVLQGRLCAEQGSETARLHALIAQAAASQVRGSGITDAMTITRRGRPALQVMVSPAAHVDPDLAGPTPVIVFVSDPARRVRPCADVLRTLYGLTAAESRVALLLGDGYAPPDIAGLIGVTTNTLKTQLASIYRKTGTARQSQLVRLLAQLTPANP